MGCEQVEQQHQEDLSTAVTSLHSSFDAVLLGNDKTQIFRCAPPRVSLGSSPWDERSPGGDLSGLRLLPRRTETTELIPPSTTRKQTRKTRSSSLTEFVQTPGRPLRPPCSAMKLPRQATTPNSSSRRRKASPLNLRQSKSPRPANFQAASSPSPLFPGGETPSILRHPASPLFQGMTPAAYNPLQLDMKYKLQQTGNTAITANTSALDITTDTEPSQESPASTPFRFTSFPASLPRVHPRPNDVTNPFCPNTTRKKVSYQARLGATLEQPDPHEADATFLKRSRPMSVMRYAREVDEAAQNSSVSSMAQNSSVSSMSVEHQLQAIMPQQAVPSFPPPDLEWKSPHMSKNCSRIDAKYSEDSDLPEPRQIVKSNVPSGLFLDTSENAYSYSDDESPVRVNVPRTRLDFNLVLSPNNEDVDVQSESTVDLSKPYAERRVNSYLSIASTLTSLQSTSEDLGTESTVILTTASMSPVRPDPPAMLERPASPAEVQFRFRLDAAQCSPILLPDRMVNEMEFDHSSPPSEPLSPVAEGLGITTEYTSEEDSRLSISQDSSGSSSSGKQRRLRPMPDMSAFDAGASVRSGSSSQKSGADDSPAPPSPKLACPPTPVRTPAWAHNDSAIHPFNRTNSLIITKVLATCPVQVVEGHSSLEETSMDMSAGDIEKRRASLSFSTVDEERGDEEMEDAEEKPRDLFDAAADSITTPPQASGPAGSVPRLLLTSEPLTELNMNLTTPFAARVYPTKSSSTVPNDEGSSISFAANFEILGELGSGAFGDVYKVRSKMDCQLYAVKRNRRQFRGKRDRDMAMAEVRTMQKLQSVCASTVNKKKSSFSLYLLFFYRAWQEEGFFYCQTELCCRDTCRELMDSLRSKWPSAVAKYPSLTKHLNGKQTTKIENAPVGRLMPDMTVWKICHDVAAGLSHIHSHGIVHNDIKPSNIFLVSHARLGAMCKIGDFGMAGDVGTAEDGQEGDTVYMPPELLSSSVKQPSGDIFSLGLTLYELASSIGWEMPVEGPRWHEVRGGSHVPELPSSRHCDLARLVQATISSDQAKRPSADDILTGLELVKEAGSRRDEFLRDYLHDVEKYDREREERESLLGGQTPRNMEQRELRTPTPGIPLAPLIFTPNP
jgi:membrane-associated tyrosine/threonine-specific cdc2-inhibitory kinase